MPKTCKIEQLGLSDTVQSLMADGVTTRAEMREKLVSEYGADVSEATVGRYMAKIRRVAENEAFHTIQDHVNRTVPDDLDALEEMEKQCLEWSREAGCDVAERTASAAAEIKGELEAWREKIQASTDDPDAAVKWIIKRAAAHLAQEDRRQEQRLSAMRQVHKIIETKLSKAGLLDDDQKGRIVFLRREASGEDDASAAPDAGRSLRIAVNNTDGSGGGHDR